MTRKDFERIARVVKAFPMFECDRSLLAARFVDALAPTNPNFKREVFLRACGVSLGQEEVEET